MAQDEPLSDGVQLALVRELLGEIHASPPTFWGRMSRWFGRRWGGNTPETERVAEELRRLAQALIFSASR